MYVAASVEKVFTLDDGTQFDIVVNLAAETKYGQSDEVCGLDCISLSDNSFTETIRFYIYARFIMRKSINYQLYVCVR